MKMNWVDFRDQLSHAFRVSIGPAAYWHRLNRRAEHPWDWAWALTMGGEMNR